MKSLLAKFFLILSLSFFIQQTVYSGTAVRKIFKATSALQKKVAAAAISLALVGGTLPLAIAQVEEAKENSWTIVSEATPQYDYLHNVLNLHVTSRDEPDTQFLFPVAYLGKSVHGEDIFIAYERPAGISLLEETAANVDLSLINYRSEMWEDVSITGHVIAEDKLDGFFNLVILSFSGAELEFDSPLQLGTYPYEDGGAMVFYKHKLAAIQNASVNNYAIVRGISSDVAEHTTAMLAGQSLPVEARGKLATTWGALKKE